MIPPPLEPESRGGHGMHLVGANKIFSFLVIVITSFKPSSDRHLPQLPLIYFRGKLKKTQNILKDKFIIKNELK